MKQIPMHGLFIFFVIIIGLVESGNSQPSARVTDVRATGDAGDYVFYVELKSPDTGCEQYADWWEVVSESGELIYRRILTHSHVDEQPFTRSGGPVKIDAKEVVIVRLHMNNTGFSTSGMKGSVSSGFESADIEASFAIDLEKKAPLPSGCRF